MSVSSVALILIRRLIKQYANLNWPLLCSNIVHCSVRYGLTQHRVINQEEGLVFTYSVLLRYKMQTKFDIFRVIFFWYSEPGFYSHVKLHTWNSEPCRMSCFPYNTTRVLSPDGRPNSQYWGFLYNSINFIKNSTISPDMLIGHF